MRVYLTGGTGLLGSHVAQELRDEGHEVVALHRRGANTRLLEELECELVEGDVRDTAEGLASGMTGCTHVVHGAALVYTSGEWPEVRAVNVNGTRNVLTAAVQVGVGHALHVSSVAVYGPVDGPVTEHTAIDSIIPAADLYARSKREAEEVARGIERLQGLPVSIVRPCAVYGERDRLMVPGLLKILRMPVVPLIGPGSNTVPAVYAGNLAGAMRLVLKAARGGTTYDLGCDHSLTQRDLLEGLARGLGTRVRFAAIPAGLVTGAARLMDRLGMSTPGAKHLPISRVVRLALGDNPYASERVRQELGWEPAHEHRDALERAARWAGDNL
jgi:nucleoside-diphosphate-sugar epimerase